MQYQRHFGKLLDFLQAFKVKFRNISLWIVSMRGAKGDSQCINTGFLCEAQCLLRICLHRIICIIAAFTSTHASDFPFYGCVELLSKFNNFLRHFNIAFQIVAGGIHHNTGISVMQGFFQISDFFPMIKI